MSTRRHLLNALPNLLWTALLALPVYVYCSRSLPRIVIYAFSAAGALMLFLPVRVLAPLQLRPKLATYRRLRVPLLLRLTQDAAWLQRWGGSHDARVRNEPVSLARALRDTWMRERFHAALLLFFSLCLLWALYHRQWIWSVAIAVSNVLYNLYPIWLQQYLRLRLELVQTRRAQR